jgi:hypothetical protein
MNKNGVADDLREVARKKWWDNVYQNLANEELLPAVKAWTLIQYESIRRKELAWLRRALADAEKNAQAVSGP